MAIAESFQACASSHQIRLLQDSEYKYKISGVNVEGNIAKGQRIAPCPVCAFRKPRALLWRRGGRLFGHSGVFYVQRGPKQALLAADFRVAQ